MQHDAAFHLGLHCLQKYYFRGFPNTKGFNSRLRGNKRMVAAGLNILGASVYVFINNFQILNLKKKTNQLQHTCLSFNKIQTLTHEHLALLSSR